MPEPEPAGEIPQFETFAVVDEDEMVQPAPVVTDEFETNGLTFSDPTASFADLNEDVVSTGFGSATIFRKSTSASLPYLSQTAPKVVLLKKRARKT